MVVLSKKRVLLVLSCIFIGLLVFTIQIAEKEKNTNSIATVALPVSNKVIVIDAGHGVPDERSRK